MKLVADVTLAPASQEKGTPAGLSLSSYCLVVAVAFSSVPEATAQCTDTATNAGAGGGSTCEATGANYGGPNISSSPVVSNDSGPPAITSLTFTAPDVTIISGGSAGRAIRADGGNITFEGNVSVYRSPNGGYGATTNAGYGLEAHGRTPDRGSVVIFEKNATFIVDVLNGDAVEVSNGASASFLGFTDITAGRYGLYSLTSSTRTPTYLPGASLIELNNLKVRSVDEALKVNGALNNTIVVTGTSVDIETSGNNGRGIQAEDGGKVFVRGAGGLGSADGNSLIVVDTSGATLLTNGSSSHGLHSVSKVGDAAVELGAGQIETVGDDAEGIYAYVNGGTGNASVTMNGGSVTAHGLDADGLVALVDDTSNLSEIHGNATIVMTAGTVTVAGDAASGLIAETDFSYLSNSRGKASVTQAGGTVRTRGNTLASSNPIIDIPLGSYALSAVALGRGNAEVIQSGGHSETSGEGAHVLYAYSTKGNNSIAQGSGAVALATGLNSSGLRAVAGLGSNTLLINGSLTGGSGLAAGLHNLSSSSSTITIGATAKVDGSASGIAIRDGDSDLDGVDDGLLGGGSTSLSIAGHVIGNVIMGLGDDSIILSTGIMDGDIYGDDPVETANDGNDSFTWTGGTWLSSFFGGGGSDTATISASSYDGTHHVLDGGDDTSTADGFIDWLTFQNISANAYGANLRNWEVITLEGAAITITDGHLQVGLDAGTGMFLRNAAVLGGGAGLRLDGNLEIDGSSAFVSAGGGAGLYAVTGSLLQAGRISLQDGAAGDRFTAQSYYHANNALVVLDTQLGADNSATDLLILQGESQGTAQLQVVNAGGLGALTTDGIKVVDVQGNSTVSFSLRGDYLFEGDPAVVGGAYAYRLYQYDQATLSDGDWYLSSVLDEDDRLEPNPPPPLYNPGTPLYESYAQHLLGASRLPTLQQRIGSRVWNGPYTTASLADGRRTEQAPRAGVWGRVEGGHRNLKPRTSTTRSDYDLDIWRLQGGVDALLHEAPMGSLLGGLTAHYVKGNSGVASRHGRGDIKSSGVGLGATLTWYGANDYYADLQGQLTWFRSDLESKTAQQDLAKGNDALAYALSLEGGRRIALTDQLTITPQAQLAYTHLHMDNFVDAFDTKVSYPTAKSLRGRLGVSLDNAFVWQERQANVYLIANVHHEFEHKTSTKVARTRFESEIEQNWGELGVGGVVQWSDQYSLYGELSYAAGLEHSGNHAVQGTLGLRVLW